MKFKLQTNITFTAENIDDAKNKLAKHFREEDELVFLGSIAFYPMGRSVIEELENELEPKKTSVLSCSQHNIGIRFQLNKKDKKIYVLSGCIILAIIVPCGKKHGEVFKIKYKSLEIDNTVGKSNYSENKQFLLVDAMEHILARISQPYENTEE